MYYVLITNNEIKIYNFILFISSSVSLVLSYTLKSTIVSVYISTIFPIYQQSFAYFQPQISLSLVSLIHGIALYVISVINYLYIYVYLQP
jgi:hypothetical protein